VETFTIHKKSRIRNKRQSLALLLDLVPLKGLIKPSKSSTRQLQELFLQVLRGIPRALCSSRLENSNGSHMIKLTTSKMLGLEQSQSNSYSLILSSGASSPRESIWGNFISRRSSLPRCANAMKKNEKVTNKYRYQIRCPERMFERYLDDMGVLVVDFFDTQLNQTVGTSKIMMKLYIKR